MILYLIQHGEAKPKEEDPDRHLSEKGMRDVRKIAEFLRPLKLSVGAIWHGGKARAAQTAELLASAVQAREGLVQRDDLSPDDEIDSVRKEIRQAEADLMIVGHLPFLSKLASRLLIGDESPSVVAFQKGGVVCLRQGDDETWQLAWMITPELLQPS